MPKTVGDPNGPGYIIYHSHVEWRNDEVPVPAERKPGPEFRVFDSHIDRTDECSLHPIVMAPQVPSRG